MSIQDKIDFQNRSVDSYNQNRSIDQVISVDQVRSVDQVISVDSYNQNRSVDSYNQNKSVVQDIPVFNTEPQRRTQQPEIPILNNIATREHNFKTHEYPSIYSIFHSILVLFAIYLSFKCNGGFSFWGFFMAIFFPYIYIIYKYATSKKFCDILK